MRFTTVPAVLVAVSLATVLSGCKHAPTEKELQLSVIHYDLGIQAQMAGNKQEAFTELEQSLSLDEKNLNAHNAMGVLLHLGFARHQEAIPRFLRAIELDPQFSEAKVNLGNVYLDLARYDEAVTLYDQALNDMRYKTPYIAQGNLGWAHFKLGNPEKALDFIKSAVTLEPKFCLGYRNLASIYESQQKLDDACTQLDNYREHCPENADAYYRLGVCLAKQGKQDEASARFAECEAKAPEGPLKDDCRRLGGNLQ
ncbi:MAG: social motility TPR repeat lipoprotein Tgl [Myxococcaceae bacterium]